MKEKVVLAYSGGLDTTAIIPWLKETFNYDVICCCIDCGQGEELDGLEERAKLSGAAKLYIEDIVDDFADNYIVPCVQAHAVYEDEYLLGTSMARPAIAKRLVEIARKENAVAICHGATGKGNDQIGNVKSFLWNGINISFRHQLFISIFNSDHTDTQIFCETSFGRKFFMNVKIFQYYVVFDAFV